MFKCSKGGCVKASLVCDGGTDCPSDASDENYRKRFTLSSFSLSSLSPLSFHLPLSIFLPLPPSLPPSSPSSPLCLPLPPFPPLYLSSPSLPPSLPPSPPAKRDCDATKEFECHTNAGVECLSLDWKCDGIVDCFDNIKSDEVNCSKSVLHHYYITCLSLLV